MVGGRRARGERVGYILVPASSFSPIFVHRPAFVLSVPSPRTPHVLSPPSSYTETSTSHHRPLRWSFNCFSPHHQPSPFLLSLPRLENLRPRLLDWPSPCALPRVRQRCSNNLSTLFHPREQFHNSWVELYFIAPSSRNTSLLWSPMPRFFASRSTI